MKKVRTTPLEIDQLEFQLMGHQLVDLIAEFIATIGNKPVTSGETPRQIQAILGDAGLPEQGSSAAELLSKTTDLLFNHSLLNGHPKFMGYIIGSPAPIGVLADLLATAVNANVGANVLSPMATAIEKQTVRWLAEFIGVAPTYGGLLVSGGNMANFTAFLAARTAQAPASLKEDGLRSLDRPLVLYCSATTHTWIEKAAVLFGHGIRSIRWIPAYADNKMNTELLAQAIENDLKNNCQPFLVVGTAGDVSTGAVDNLAKIAAICKKYDLWFHIDGAYGMPAAVIPELQTVFAGMHEADSIALDPHKWLYAPLEAGCTLVKNPQHLTNTYSSHAAYYNFGTNEENPPLNYYEYGFQNSRGFRALKVWLMLQQVGRRGYQKMIREDIALAALLFSEAEKHPELEAITHNLSITTLRFVPQNFARTDEDAEHYLNTLNEKLLNQLQQGGKVFLSNAIVSGKYCLRGCIVNFRTSQQDIFEIIELIVEEGRKTHEIVRYQTVSN